LKINKYLDIKNLMRNREVKIGLALGGGGAKGGAHLGVLKVFEEEGIKIDRMAGVSSGAITGAAYCLNYPVSKIIKLAEQFKNYKVLGISNINFFGDSIAKNKKLKTIIKNSIGESTFPDCKIPYDVIAVDLEAGEEVVLNEGAMWPALMASSAIPGLFPAYFYNNRYLADGGILNNIPVNRLRSYSNIDIVIGIDLGLKTSKQHLSGMIWEKYYNKRKTFNLQPGFFHKVKINYSLLMENIFRSIDLTREEAMMQRINEAQPDIIIFPKTDSISVLEFEKYEQVIEAGEIAAREIMPKLKKLISQKLSN